MYQLDPESHRVAVGYIHKNMSKKAKKPKTELSIRESESELTFFKDMQTCALWGFWVSAGKKLSSEIRWFCSQKVLPKQFVFTTHHMSDLYQLAASKSIKMDAPGDGGGQDRVHEAGSTVHVGVHQPHGVRSRSAAIWTARFGSCRISWSSCKKSGE